MTSYTAARSAIVNVNEQMANVYDLKQGDNECRVLGLFQITYDNSAEPVFVCEFPGGKVINIYTGFVRFVDKEY